MLDKAARQIKTGFQRASCCSASWHCYHVVSILYPGRIIKRMLTEAVPATRFRSRIAVRALT